ncbi:prolipoprotein diacylglyceryl transferase [Patescibacteria group bacterium]|nr:prolipoprotein diacylglyceryl transferase [Patescibacteria group bacterium]MBU1721748.1 prolipoprotein diacylglyceryl transferase [Patescibacteria group bacterium]MBU1901413.1 prolipoprotein diacylglyceryl transferase [Patescibacteria group bacterium]
MFINTINPILLQASIFTIRWYGVFLALGVVIASLIIRRLFIRHQLGEEMALSLVIWLTVGGLIGARLGEALFYEPAYYFADPIRILFVHQGGLSSHGMTLGILITFALFTWRKKLDWKCAMDIVSLGIPIVAGFIRVGNFFNSEIVGRVTDMPWGVYFPRYETMPLLLRHPSQLYEAFLAWSIAGVLFILYKKYGIKRPLLLTNTFVLLYFSSRFFVEFFKEYQTLSHGLTMGQWLSLPFILWGIGWFVLRYRKQSF